MIPLINPPLEVTVPHENVNDPTAKLLLWKVPSGAKVSEGDPIAELENSKATFEITAPASGVVEYSRPVGQEVPVGETLFCILGEGAQPRQQHVSVTPTLQTPAPSPPTRTTRTVFSKRAQELLAELKMDPALFSGML